MVANISCLLGIDEVFKIIHRYLFLLVLLFTYFVVVSLSLRRAGAAAAMLEEVISLAGSDFENANDQKLVADMYMAKKHGIRVDFFASMLAT